MEKSDLNYAVIILNYNNFNETIECINEILKHSKKMNILVVDNASNNGSYEILTKKYIEEKNVDVIKTDRNGGYSYGNNYGIKYLLQQKSYKYLFIMNPDVRIKYNIFENIVKKMDTSDDIAIMSGMMINNSKYSIGNSTWKIPNNKEVVSDNILFHRKKNKINTLIIKDNAIAYTEVISGSFFCFNVENFKKINFFDEDEFLYNEENILSIKLKEIGYKVALSINDYYYHNHSMKKLNYKQLKNNVKIGYNSRKVLCKKYYNKKWILFLLKMTYLINMIYIKIKFIGRYKNE